MPPWQSSRRTILLAPGDPWPLPQSPRTALAPQNSNPAKPVLHYIFFFILFLRLCSLFEANLYTLQEGISHLPLPTYSISFRAPKIPTPLESLRFLLVNPLQGVPKLPTPNPVGRIILTHYTGEVIPNLPQTYTSFVFP